MTSQWSKKQCHEHYYNAHITDHNQLQSDKQFADHNTTYTR